MWSKLAEKSPNHLLTDLLPSRYFGENGLPDLNLVDVVRGDFGFVVAILWENDELVEEVGIYSGYAASQGVLRALSHYFQHDTSYPAWSPEPSRRDVSGFVEL